MSGIAYMIRLTFEKYCKRYTFRLQYLIENLHRSAKNEALGHAKRWEVFPPHVPHHPNTQAKIKGATIVASLSTMYLGVFMSSLPQVIFSFGTAPE